MKPYICIRWSLGIALALMPLAGGCLQQSGAGVETAGLTQASETLEVTENVDPQKNANTLEDEAADTSDALSKVVSNQKPLPSNIHPTEALGSVLRLVESGVDESVLLSFVTNTTGTFSLGSDEVIYLSDLGVPGSVVTAMLQHDHLLVENAQAAAVAQSPLVAAPEPAPTLPPEPLENPPPPDYASSSIPPEQSPSEETFYDALAPYGTWVDVEGTGRCWQPSVTVINRDWQPYCDRGHWVYTDCGWYWASDYSWGWAPFHYGRWFRHTHLGWCWAPDRVWGPSWVSWRYSNDYCGWAPLPPVAHFRPGLGFSYRGHSVGFNFNFGLSASCYTFVPTRNFCDLRLSHRRLPHDHVARIFQSTVAVNRIVGDNNRISNYGIPAERITAVTHARLRQVPVRSITRNIEPQIARTTEHREGMASNRRPEVLSEPRVPRNIIRFPKSEPMSASATPGAGAAAQATTSLPDRSTRPSRLEARNPQPTRNAAPVGGGSVAQTGRVGFGDNSRQPWTEPTGAAERFRPNTTQRAPRQDRSAPLVIRREGYNPSALASRSTDLNTRAPVTESSFGLPQRSFAPGASRNVEGRPRYEAPQRGTAVPPQVTSTPVPPRASSFSSGPNRFDSRPAPAMPSVPTYSAPPVQRSMSEASHREGFARSASQPSPSFQSGVGAHHQSQASAPMPSVSRSASSGGSSTQNNSSSDRRGR